MILKWVHIKKLKFRNPRMYYIILAKHKKYRKLYLVTDVSVQPLDPIFKSQEVQE